MGESPLVRYSVILMDRTSGSSAACSMNRWTDPVNDSYGWWTSRSPARMAANTSGSSRRRSAGGAAAGRAATDGAGDGATSRSAMVVSSRRSSMPEISYTSRRLQAEALLEQRPGGPGHRPLDLQADDLAEAAPAQLLLDGQQQVVRLVLLDRDVGVARHPEQVVVDDLHAREQGVQVGGDDLLDQDVRAGAHLPQSGQHRRHLDAREAVLALVRVAHGDRQRQRQVADVREGMRRVDRERRQDREDLVEEALPQLEVALRPLLVAGRSGCPRRPARSRTSR